MRHRASRLAGAAEKTLSVVGKAEASRRIARAIVRPVRLLLFSPIVFFLSLYVAFSFGLMFLLFSSFSTVFQGQYGFSTATSGLSYIGLGVGMFAGVLAQGVLSDKILKSRERRNGRTKPEDRLPLMAYMAPTLPVGMFWYGWSAAKHLHWIMPIIGGTFVGLGFVFIMV